MLHNINVMYLTRILYVLRIKKNKKMPQLVPFYFVNEIIFTFVIIILTTYMLSKYILPRFVRLFYSRIFLINL